jgi:predicted ATPase
MSRRTSRAGSPIDPGLGRAIHARTDGNPLFVTATVDYLRERGILATAEGRWHLEEPLDGVVPDGLRQLALQRLDELAPGERRVLDAASVAGAGFAVATVAAAAELPMREVEAVCTTLTVRTELVTATGVDAWPDGTVSGRYEFRHVLHREVLEHALPAMRRRHLHHAVGERLEAAWGSRAAEIGAELAVHFDAAGDVERSVRHYLAAATGARARCADEEVVIHLRAAIERLQRLPETAERAQLELGCLLDLRATLVATRGAASDEAVAIDRRTVELADALERPPARS